MLPQKKVFTRNFTRYTKATYLCGIYTFFCGFKSRFYDAFLKITGRTPIEIKHQIQAYKAEFLLKNTDLTVEDITHRVGYYSVANFRKMFLSRYQATNLREYRKQAKEE